ncbi:zinc ribbon domain-containing protein [Pseudomonas schmalbachii]|uniref:RanBP2-type domain-containing protein n=1 Tax=Pseudomonas schmalbachii TaxID=2816993 RepID=A0ABS3TRM9_9PSED|nr:hypothetical protein [Pseudomonas schmalbachii]
MTAYRWTCLACDEPNDADSSSCIKCGCPSNASAVEVEAHRHKMLTVQGKEYRCQKCNHDKYQVGETRNAGGLMSSVFEIETEKFSFIACARCGYTEFYRGEKSMLRNLFDLYF